MKKQLFIILAFILMLTVVCSAHPGRTDKHGGHTNKATGEYHFHNPDGTVTVGTNPQESNTKSVNTEPATTEHIEAETTNTATGPGSATNTQTDTIIVDDTEKPLQKEVIESITVNEAGKETKKSSSSVKANTKSDSNIPQTEVHGTKEITKITDKNGDTYIYVPAKHRFADLSQMLIFILSLFALLGFCIFSSFICLLFKKIEKPGSVWQTILHVPYLIFWLPSLLGNLLFKLYYKVIPSDELDNLDNNGEEDEYEI